MWCNKKDMTVIYNHAQLENEIISSSKRGFFIDGPTGCGKTFFLKHMKSDDLCISPFCVILEGLSEHVKCEESIEKYYAELEQRFSCKVLGLEDIDYSLAGKELTQNVIADLLNRLSCSRKIILTGIGIDKRCDNLLSSIGASNYGYFLYV